MSNEKGGLIKKKKKPIMPPPAPVIKTQAAEFSYSPAPVEEEVKQPVKEQKKPKTIGKKNRQKHSKFLLKSILKFICLALLWMKIKHI